MLITDLVPIWIHKRSSNH